MNCAHLYSLVFAIIGAVLIFVGRVLIVSVQTVTLPQPTNDDSSDPYGIGTMPTGMQMTSDMTNEVVSMPSTSISGDPCPCSSLVQKSNSANTKGQTYERTYIIFVPIFQQAVVSHAHNLWDAACPCPHPEGGASFNGVTSTIWTAFSPVYPYDAISWNLPLASPCSHLSTTVLLLPLICYGSLVLLRARSAIRRILASVALLACKEKRYPNRVKRFLEEYA